MTVDGFAVIYRWRVRSGMEASFVEAWEFVTRAIRDQRGGLGSCLHRADDGTWVAYARWPSRDAWERSQAEDSPDPAASDIMRDSIEESFDPIPLGPVRDLLARD